MDLVVDVSFGWNDPTMSAVNLKAKNVDGVIAYVNTVDPRKNVSRARFEEWLGGGLQVGLVFENGNTDALGGASAGSAHAQIAYNQAIGLGYDIHNCVMFFALDWDVQPSQYAVCAEYAHAIGGIIPYSGFYSNSGLLDNLALRGLGRSYWQSNSTSYSNGVSQHAHLLQKYNDPRVAGLPADANDVLRIPVGFMGGTKMPILDAQDLEAIKQEVNDVVYGVLNDATHPNLFAYQHIANLVVATLGNVPSQAITQAQIQQAVVAALQSVKFGVTP